MIEYYCKVNEQPRDINVEINKEEAIELLSCWMNESMRRYNRVNLEAPLYLKLRRIIKMKKI